MRKRCNKYSKLGLIIVVKIKMFANDFDIFLTICCRAVTCFTISGAGTVLQSIVVDSLVL